MRIARFSVGSGPVRIGRVDLHDDAELALGGDGTRASGTVVDLSGVPGVGDSLRELLPRLAELGPALAAAEGERFDLAEVTVHAPIDSPRKFLGIGMNYKEHAAEAALAGIPTPASQMWFNKQVSCLNDPYGDIVRPRVSEQLDYEIELGVVIGRAAKDVSAEDARSYIAGYVVTNDVSVRDWLQKLSPTFTLGKSFDTHGPVGPWLTTDDAIADPLDLGLRLTVNGEVRQEHRTNDMIYNAYEQIAYLSQVFTLEPGDILATGTPAGIGAPTQNWLVPGDVVRAQIEGLGFIENTVVNWDA
jgi:2-keto-4-pentenoate hydratase/2-oxohepta-3-ene-1,7-dioic acid hydratase in catechol pathway